MSWIEINERELPERNGYLKLPHQVRHKVEFVDLPRDLLLQFSCAKILADNYGFRRSVEEGLPVDAQGDPLPLYTYPAIEYLRQLDFSQKRVFEYGSGNSTLFWSQRAESVVAVENNREWFLAVRKAAPRNVRVLFEESNAYPDVISKFAAGFDVIIIDGCGYRFDCARRAVEHLAPGGLIILDNADCYYRTAALLSSHGLIQIDMAGFKPGEHFTSTTSLFLHRDYDFRPAGKRQPVPPIGTIEVDSCWDHPSDSPEYRGQKLWRVASHHRKGHAAREKARQTKGGKVASQSSPTKK